MNNVLVQERLTGAAIELSLTNFAEAEPSLPFDLIAMAALRGLPSPERSAVIDGLNDLLTYL